MQKKIAIIGGGVTGLSAAYYLLEKQKDTQLPFDFQLFEKSDRFGGKIYTSKQAGFTIERGADSFLARKESATRLVKKLGLEEDLVRNETGQAFVLVKNKLHKIPAGSYRGIPTRLGPYFNSSMFSLKGKLRGAMDLFLPKGELTDDLSLGALFRRRYGNEFVDHLIEPLLAGIYSGDIDQMSVAATLPELIEIEQKYGSLTKGLRETLQMPKNPPRAKQGAFYSLKSGLDTMIDALERELAGKVTKNITVNHIEKTTDGYHLLLSDGTVYEADGVIMATEHHQVPKILSQYDFVKDNLEQVPTTSTANVAIGFPKSAFKRKIDGTGFVISRKSDTRITACTWTDKKWPNTTPEGKALVRCYVGKPNDQEVIHNSDTEITDIVLRDLYKTMKIKADPEIAVVTRWPEARPQYTVGHVQRLQQLEDRLAEELPGIYLAGSSYEGVGIPDCINQGEAKAQEVLRFVHGLLD